MKKLILVMLGLFTLIYAQGDGITCQLAPDGSFIVQDADGHTLIQTLESNGWTRFGNTALPGHPLDVSSNYYDPDGPWLQPTIFGEFTGSGDGVGVEGRSLGGDGYGIGVTGQGSRMGVYGWNNPTGNHHYYGVVGDVYGGTGYNHGVYGYAYNGYNAYGGYFYGGYGSHQSWGAYGKGEGSTTNYGLYGVAQNAAPTTGWNCGVYGGASTATGINYGVFGYASDATTNWAGYFSGNVHVTGTLSKAAGSFKIDHPLDPENKYLSHSFVESPDMMNIYNGNVELNYSGEAEIELPEWFDALNSDFRYQLTAIGAPGPNLYVAEEVNGNNFRIAGGTPGMKVSWQLTGIRQDVYAKNNRIKVEEYKTADDIGKYLHPEAHGMSKSMQINYDMIPQEKEMAKDKKQIRTIK